MPLDVYDSNVAYHVRIMSRALESELKIGPSTGRQLQMIASPACIVPANIVMEMLTG